MKNNLTLFNIYNFCGYNGLMIRSRRKTRYMINFYLQDIVVSCYDEKLDEFIIMNKIIKYTYNKTVNYFKIEI